MHVKHAAALFCNKYALILINVKFVFSVREVMRIKDMNFNMNSVDKLRNSPRLCLSNGNKDTRKIFSVMLEIKGLSMVVEYVSPLIISVKRFNITYIIIRFVHSFCHPFRKATEKSRSPDQLDNKNVIGSLS